MVASLDTRCPAQLTGWRMDPDPHILGLRLLPELLCATQPPVQVSGHGDRMHLFSPRGLSVLKARDTRVSHPRRSNHRSVVLEQWSALLVGLVEPRNLPLLVRNRFSILAAAPVR